MPSELVLSTHLPTLEGWTADLAVGLWLVVPTAGFEPTRVDLTRTREISKNHIALLYPLEVTNPKKAHATENTLKVSSDFNIKHAPFT